MCVVVAAVVAVVVVCVIAGDHSWFLIAIIIIITTIMFCVPLSRPWGHASDTPCVHWHGFACAGLDPTRRFVLGGDPCGRFRFPTSDFVFARIDLLDRGPELLFLFGLEFGDAHFFARNKARLCKNRSAGAGSRVFFCFDHQFGDPHWIARNKARLSARPPLLADRGFHQWRLFLQTRNISLDGRLSSLSVRLLHLRRRRMRRLGLLTRPRSLRRDCRRG